MKNPNPFPNIEPFLRPTLRIFLSVDLIDSTKLKQSGSFPIGEKNEKNLDLSQSNWFSPIAVFYKKFSLFFLEQWADFVNETCRKFHWKPGPPPQIWKTNGDELLYFKEVHEFYQAYAAIRCWLSAVYQYRQVRENQVTNLDIKATAWLAGFPIANHEIIFVEKADEYLGEAASGRGPAFENFYYLSKWYKEERANLQRDFIGPSIDTGFRIAKYSTNRKLIVNIELAYLLSCMSHPKIYPEELVIKFLGLKNIKGVLGDKPYPIFWIDTFCGDNLSASEDMISGSQKVPNDQIRKYSELFIKSNKEHLFIPFTTRGSEAIYSERPENYDRKLKYISKKWKEELKKFTVEQESVSGKSPRGDTSTRDEPSDNQINTFAQEVPTRTRAKTR